jgi:hypothetical protein
MEPISMPRSFRFIAFTFLSLASAFANAQVQTQRGATLGGLAGALAGGLIGDNNNEAGAGAAIGGVVGAVAGGFLGNAADKQAAIDHQYQRYQHQQLQQQQFARTQSAVSVSDVVTMSRSGLGDQVIINQLNQRGVKQTLQVPDIIALHEQGVSETVITAMQQASTPAQRVARASQTPQRIVAPAPVIVEEHHVLPHYAPPRYYHRRPTNHHHHHGFHIRF